jgi:hypothetical protein
MGRLGALLCLAATVWQVAGAGRSVVAFSSVLRCGHPAIAAPDVRGRRGQGGSRAGLRGGLRLLRAAAGAGERGQAGGLPGQDSTPLLSALADAASKVRVPFFFPGHQMGRGSPLAFMDEALSLDLPEDVEGLDCLSYADGPIREAQQLAARLFGARHSFFLCNGSTGGILAALMAAVQRHRRQSAHAGAPVVILPRNAHKSAVQGLILSGAQAVWLPPLYDPRFEIAFAFRLGDLEAALREHDGRVAAVMCVSPTYHGVIQNVSAVKVGEGENGREGRREGGPEGGREGGTDGRTDGRREGRRGAGEGRG